MNSPPSLPATPHRPPRARPFAGLAVLTALLLAAYLPIVPHPHTLQGIDRTP